jgi:hypothetical protein
MHQNPGVNGALAVVLCILGSVQCKAEPNSAGPQEPKMTATKPPLPAPASLPAETTLGRLSCSPVVGSEEEKGIYFARENEVSWGEALPICGYVRVTPAIASPQPSSSFAIHVRPHGSDEFSQGSENFVLGKPRIQDDPRVFEILTTEGQLYFNTRAYNEYTVLAPGDYDISLRYFNMESERKHIRVIANGWRQEVATFLKREVCDGTIVETFKDYLEIQHFLSVADMDEEAAEAAYADRDKAGSIAYANYATQVKAEWQEGMRAEHRIDSVVPAYAIKLATEACPAKKEAIENIVYLYEAFKNAT